MNLARHVCVFHIVLLNNSLLLQQIYLRSTRERIHTDAPTNQLLHILAHLICYSYRILVLCQVDCLSSYSTQQCADASLSEVVSYPIDWTVGAGAVMSTDWCPMTINTAVDECPSPRYLIVVWMLMVCFFSNSAAEWNKLAIPVGSKHFTFKTEFNRRSVCRQRSCIHMSVMAGYLILCGSLYLEVLYSSVLWYGIKAFNVKFHPGVCAVLYFLAQYR